MTGYSEVTNAVAAMASIQSCKRKKTKIVCSASFLNIPFNESQATKLCRFLFIAITSNENFTFDQFWKTKISHLGKLKPIKKV